MPIRLHIADFELPSIHAMFSWGIPNATIFSLSVLAAIVLVWRSRSTRIDGSAGDWRVRLMLLLVCVGVAIVSVPSLVAFQKWLTNLALPVGLLWLGLLLGALLLHAYRFRRLVVLVWLLWLLLTVAGNEAVSRRLLSTLENEFARIDPLAVASRHAPFDLVVALGGSTRKTPAGQVQLTDAGDRALLAARLYHAGHTKRLAATGQPNEELLGPGRHPADEARVLWRGLNIPDEAIVLLKGSTTKGELEFIAEHVRQEGWERVGIVTSAWHMRRAMRLASDAGLRVEPLPAHFEGVVPGWKRFHFVPTAQALSESSRALKEFLAQLAGR